MSGLGPPLRRSGTIVQSAFTGIKTDSANKRYLFNAISDTNHNANPTNPNRYSKGNPSEWRTVTEWAGYYKTRHKVRVGIAIYPDQNADCSEVFQSFSEVYDSGRDPGPVRQVDYRLEAQ